MKEILSLNLLPQFNNNKKAVRNVLLQERGTYNIEHYKKYWLKEDLEKVFDEENAWSFAIKEYSKEEFEALSNEDNIEITKINNMKEKTKICSAVHLFVDFEENNYNYYNVIKRGKRVCHEFIVRVVK